MSNEEGGRWLWMCHYVIYLLETATAMKIEKEEKRKNVCVCYVCKGWIERYWRKYPY